MFPLVKDKKVATNGSFPLMSNFFLLQAAITRGFSAYAVSVFFCIFAGYEKSGRFQYPKQ